MSCYAIEQVECLDDNLASEFVSGSMAATTQSRVEKHLATCRDCRDLVAALAGPGDDSDVATHPRHDARDGLTESQAGKLPALSIGDRVGRYLVLSTLGAGGMGMVFAAYDPQLDRKIALKVLRTNLGANTADARKRLKREAQAIARLNHPNVVGVYDVGTTSSGEDVYIAMEFVEGDTLTAWLKRYPRTLREILEVFGQAGRGLMAAHSVGLLHRDFKPDNVLVGSDGRVRVTDFGLARSLFGIDDSNRGPVTADPSKLIAVDLTATGTVLGTPRYMPPEQLQGPNIDARSDQFSFCVALYEALFSKHPLHEATSVAMLERGTPAGPPPADSRVPSRVSRAVMRGLSRDRAERFHAMVELVHELAPPEPRPKLRLAVAIAAMTIVLGAATAAIVATRPHQPAAPVHEIDEPAIAAMNEQIQQLKAEVKKLRQQLAQSVNDTQEARALVAVKEQMIESLTEKVEKLRASVPPPHPQASPSQSQAVTTAVASSQHDLEGCFDEWASRPLEAESIGSAHSLARGSDADVEVALSVAPDGTASSVEANGDDVKRSPSLKLCIESAIERVKYPTGSEALDLAVAVMWVEPNMVNMSARVVGHHPPTM